MSSVKKIIIAISVLVAVFVAVAVFISSNSNDKPINAPDDYAYTMSVDTEIDKPVEQTGRASDEAVFNVNSDRYVEPESSEIDSRTAHAEAVKKASDAALPDEYLLEPYMLFDEQPVYEEGLKGYVKNHDMSALTAYFDNVEFRPGIYVSDIIDKSYWYTARENDIVKPGGTTFLCLENTFWSSPDIQLADKVTHNGDIVLWVCNYSNTDAMVRDCIVYKYQISYLNCWANYSEHPELNYLSKYSLGQEADVEKADKTEYLTTNAGLSYKRYVYGSDNDCQVFLDVTKNYGLLGLTVMFNYCYGPDFGIVPQDDQIADDILVFDNMGDENNGEQ